MKIASLLFMLLLSINCSAQISHGGAPDDWGRLQVGQYDLPTLTLAQTNLSATIAEDSLLDADKSAGYRFGIEHEVDVDLLAEAEINTTSDGERVYRYSVSSPGATSLSFLLSDFYIADGGKLYLWNAERNVYLGAFTSENNKAGGMFPIGLIHSDQVIFEFHQPAGVDMISSMRLTQVTHGYREILYNPKAKLTRGPFGNSGPCNINVFCPEGWDHLEEISSVALMVSGGFAFCSGALIANTTGDNTPYFLTADHCFNGSAGSNPTVWLYYFRHQASDCEGNTGPINKSIAGGELLTRNSSSDVALIELFDVPPNDYAPYYAGWNSSLSSNVTNSTFSVHHPSGDVKKICVDDNAPTFAQLQGAALWRVNEWELGVTEGGSSGGPLFSQEGHIIGQLFGGQAACNGEVNNGQFDVYGRFGVSYPLLAEWLDPANIAEEQVFEGYYIYEDTVPIFTDTIPMVDTVPNEVIIPPLELQFTPSITNGLFVLQLNQDAAFQITVFNSLGQDAYVTQTTLDSSHYIDLRGIVPRGIYIFRLEGPLGTYTIRGAYVDD